ncbi:MAG: hypothetical protein AAFW98_03610, partial [Pseudomonadota bacterium]
DRSLEGGPLVKRRSIVIGLAALTAVASAATVFIMKKDAEHDARAIAKLNRQIAAERQRISELKAEWSALDHPARLQVLVDRHNDVLKLSPIRAEQIVRITEVASAARRRAEAEAAEAQDEEAQQ